MHDYSIDIVKLLNTGHFVSGNLLAVTLHISRSRVWQIIQKLKTSGLQIDAVSGKGYKLIQTVELLEKTQIEKHLKTYNHFKNSNIKVLTHVDSTNLHLLKHFKKYSNPTVILAESQYAGRGRRGKSWMGSFASGLALSFYHQFTIANNQLAGLSLITGLSIIKALQDINIHAKIKWPNDIYVNNKKLAGILIDIISSKNNQSKVVTGIGLNINLPDNIKQKIDQPIIDLHSITNKTISRNQLSALIIKHIHHYYHLFEQNGLKPLLREWQQYDCLLDKKISIKHNNETLLGIAKGVTDTGALKVSINGQISTLYSGEVSLKLV